MNAPEGLRSGRDAQRAGMVPEYAQSVKDRLLASGESEEQAEKVRVEIVARWQS